ncbi:hypothetical protein VW35_12220 [Devosia soli]|uniref:Release factor glutamine methyltransferase n=1 Tax=Devosia soli TaxID=361041 RepID=A0A0F5L7R1_9HYPH|nr:peptide chain release factor N(5)-glutamine methyltransferase [Devosia soli]KKB78388.1 hypothetical protein VW35_12220 [Devosia soli]
MGALWRRWRDELTEKGFATPTLDAKLLVGHVLGLDALQLALKEGETVSSTLTSSLAEVFERRLSGESVARIIGHREFYGLDFGLNAATLEPRPDTELLVDLALEALPEGGRLLDMGTGTGCIPISVLINRPDAVGVATDLSMEALAQAGDNAKRHGVEGRLTLLQGNWFGALGSGERFDLILSNPPYIETAVVETLAAEVKDFDPLLALDGGPDGLAPYRVIANGARDWLRPNGRVLVEIGFDQGESVSGLFAAAGFSEISVHKDLAGLDRVVSAHHLKDTKAS